MTLVVVGLDGADPRLSPSHRFECAGEAETFTYSLDYPYTGEIWPTVATGLHPSDHGITQESESEWSNPILDLGSWVLNKADVSGDTRKRLGDAVEETTGTTYSLGTTDAPTVFDAEGRYVHNWPGVHRTEELQRIWGWFRETNKKGMSTDEFMRRARPTAASKFAWLEEGLATDAALVASHVHILDVVGHLFSHDEQRVRDEYDWAFSRVESLVDALGPDDDLLVMSDHGITFEWLGDDSGGGHSHTAFTATTCESRPLDMFDAHDWIESHCPDFSVSEEVADLPEEQLKDLGYI